MSKLSDLRQVLEWAVNKTRTVIPYSSNFPDPKRQLQHRRLYLELTRRRGKDTKQKALINELFNWHLDLSPEQERYPLNDSEIWVKTLNKKISFRKLKEKVLNMPTRISKYNTIADDLRWNENLAVKALKFGIGNCEELTAYALILLLEYPVTGIKNLPQIKDKFLIEIVYFDIDFPNEHKFLICNRNPDSTLNDILSWDDDTLFADPWSSEVYTKEEFFKKMSPEEKEYIVQKFKTLKKDDEWLKNDYFIGENHNSKTHSDEWLLKHDGSKFWRPTRLIFVESRPKFQENLQLFQNPSKSHQISGHFSLDIILVPEDTFELCELYGGTKMVDSFSGVFDLKELIDCFNSLKIILNQTKPPYEFPVLLEFENPKFKATVIYHENQWVLSFPRTQQLFKIKDEAECAAKLFDFFSHHNKETTWIIFATNISRMKKDFQRLEYILPNWSILQKEKELIFDKEKIKYIDSGGIHLLHVASQNGDAELVRHLLERGVNPNQPLANGETPLFLCAENATYRLAVFLTAHPHSQSIDHSKQDELFNILRNDLMIAALLLENGADPNVDHGGITPLILAVLSENDSMIEILLKHKANLHKNTVVNIQDLEFLSESFHKEREIKSLIDSKQSKKSKTILISPYEIQQAIRPPRLEKTMK